MIRNVLFILEGNPSLLPRGSENMPPKRVEKEIREFIAGRFVSPTIRLLAQPESNEGGGYFDDPRFLSHLVAVIAGPTNTPYEGGSWFVDMELPPEYPFKPPRVCFRTKIFHCNVTSEGLVSLDILSHSWSPVFNLFRVLTTLEELLKVPNVHEPLNAEVAQLFKADPARYNREVMAYTRKYAM